jgi:FG-GAP-like repeat/ASPIC and UnbV
MRVAHYTLFVAAFLFATETFAQWARVVEPFPSNWYMYPGSMGSGVSFFDVDEDGWDDITVAAAGNPTKYYRNNQGSFELLYAFPNTNDGKSCVWADIENDGDNDLVVSRTSGGLQVFRNEGGNVFLDISSIIQYLENAEGSYWGISLSDMDRDSYLDLAVANYSMSSPNALFKNITGNTLQQVYQPALESNTSLSFQPAFADINSDFYPEVFFCNDHEQGNELYLLDSDGIYTDESQSSGVYFPADAMSAAWCDVDHDHDLDLFASNSPMAPYLLMLNNGSGQFSLDPNSDLIHSVQGWGTLFIDAENDGWEDLFICTQVGQYNSEGNNVYLHNENGVFIDNEISAMTDLALGFYSNAKGDYNNDGRYDILATPEVVESLHLFENTTSNTAHYLKFKLNGRLSNRNGFGVHYTCHCGDFVSYGYTQCGENYLSQNSQNIILGLNDHTLIDSLILAWPSGIIDKYYHVPVDQFLQFTEAETLDGISVAYDPCGFSLPVASVNAAFTDIVWSIGDVNTTSIVANTDSLAATVSTGFGNSIQFSLTGIQTEISSYTWEITPPLCNTSQGIAHLNWVIENSSTMVDTSFTISQGLNHLSYTTTTGCLISDTLFTEAEFSINVLQTLASPICQGQDFGIIELLTETTHSSGIIDTILHSIDGLAAGWNSGIVTDNQNCSIDWSAYIPQSTWNITAQQPQCAEDPTGQIVIEYFPDENEIISFADTLSQLTSGYYERSYESMPDGCAFQWELMLNPLESIDWALNYPNLLCPGDSFQLSAEVITSGNIITWNGPENNSWLEAGSYTLSIETANGCISQQAFTIENYAALSVEETITYEEDFAEIEISVPDDLAPVDCIWQDGTLGNDIQVNLPGSYTYTITDELGCVLTDSVWVENWLTEVQEIQDFFTINHSQLTGRCALSVVHVVGPNGKLLMQRDYMAPAESFRLPSGIYLVWSRELKPTRICIP